MDLGLLMFPSPAGSADMARMVEALGFRSLVWKPRNMALRC